MHFKYWVTVFVIAGYLFWKQVPCDVPLGIIIIGLAFFWWIGYLMGEDFGNKNPHND